MYVGRIVAVGRTRTGANAGLYRVSSRSFPNRRAVEVNGRLAIMPREGHEGDILKSPYIAYNCLRVAGAWSVVTSWVLIVSSPGTEYFRFPALRRIQSVLRVGQRHSAASNRAIP